MSAPAENTAHARPAEAELWVARLGLVAYRDAVELQRRLQARRQAEEIPDTLLLLEHPPVYTRGRRSADQELTLGATFYEERGIEIVGSDRGGRVTYHGPGQLVGYPIMRVGDVIAHLRTIERSLVAALAGEGVRARSRVDDGPDWTGVWVGERKIASLGVHVSRGVSTHGFAVNVVNDLEPFSWIVPCGLSGVQMTSLARERGEVDEGEDLFERFAPRVAQCFAEAHGRGIVEVAEIELGVGGEALAPAGRAAA